MQFPKIVAMIDARIALLEQARDVLAESSRASRVSHPGAARRRPRVAPAVRVATTVTLPVPPEIAPVPVVTPEPKRLPFVAPRQRSSARKKAVTAETQSALAAHLPAGPVVVSAARVQEEEAQRRNAEGKALPVQKPESVESREILRGWLQEHHAREAVAASPVDPMPKSR